jgi:anaerobic selenocysteine-containing dehydrogenase
MSKLARHAEVVLPGASWAEKAGVFENVDHRLQAFEQAIRPVGEARSEGQIGLDLLAEALDEGRTVFNAATLRSRLAEKSADLRSLETDVHFPARPELRDPDMQLVEL